MTAPFAIPARALRRRIARLVLPLVLVLVAALVAAGCDKPEVLLDLPDGLPTTVKYLPGDSMGWVQFDTDPDSQKWSAVEQATDATVGDSTVSAFAARLLGDDVDLDADFAPWVGKSGGYMVVTSDVSAADATVGFFEVRSRGKLESSLKARGFREHGGTQFGPGPGGDLTWWSAPEGGDLPAVAVGDEAVLYAKTKAGLAGVLDTTDDLSSYERRGTNRFSAQAATSNVPFAVIYRGDTVRDQLLRLVKDDPSTLELARWFATMTFVSASRDGWVGVLPPLDDSRRAVRLVGAFEWAKGQSSFGEPQAVKRVALDDLPGDTQVAVLVDNPGALSTDFLRSATGGGFQFATKQDVPKGEQHVNVLKLLEHLDGNATVSVDATGTVRGDFYGVDVRDTVQQVNAAARLFGLDDRITADPVAGTRHVIVTYEPARDERTVTDGDDAQRNAKLADEDAYTRALAAAGTPPREPIAWAYSATSCDPEQGIAAWLTWDKDKRMSWSADVPLGALDGPACATQLASTVDVTRLLVSGATSAGATGAEVHDAFPITFAVARLIARLTGQPFGQGEQIGQPMGDDVQATATMTGSPVDVTIE